MIPGSNLSKHRLRRIDDHLGACVARGEVAGAVGLVERRGQTHVAVAGVMDLAAGTSMSREAIFRIASMTKPITAAAAMILVEEARIGLDDPVERWLPELADRRVLRELGASLTDTVPAARAITVRDLLTFRMGLGAIMAPPGRFPIQAAIGAAGLQPGPVPAPFGPDEWMRRLSALPLTAQPGEAWQYHTASDVLGVLIARAAGQPFEIFLAERIFGPLGMADTGFFVPPEKIARLTTAYVRDHSGAPKMFDPPAGGVWSRPPAFASGGGGLVSTADDMLMFGRMMRGLGRLGADRVLSRPSVELMTCDHLTEAQKAASSFFPGFWEANGWGFGMSVTTARFGLADSVGSYGWNGGVGTHWRNDPAEDMTCVFLVQRMMTGPSDTRIADDFMTLAYQAIDD